MFEISISETVNYVEHIGIIRAFHLPRGTLLSFSQCLGGTEKIAELWFARGDPRLTLYIRNFSKHFLVPFLMQKTQSSIEFQNSVLHPFHFRSLYFIAIVEILFLIRYPIEKHFKKGYYFQGFLSWKCIFQQSSSFKSQTFLQPFDGPPWRSFECH